MLEEETDQVRVKNVDPTTFKHLLKFLYTGMVDPSAINRDLFTVADKFLVDTLVELWRPASQTVDEDDIFKTFLSCWMFLFIKYHSSFLKLCEKEINFEIFLRNLFTQLFVA